MALLLNRFTSPQLPATKLRRSLPEIKITSMSTDSTTNSSCYATDIDSGVEAYLRHALPIRHPQVVHRPINELVFSAPKTVAPALCVAACELVGGRIEDAVAAASAINLMHAAACTRDQLPNLLPRPNPSTFPHNIALLAGDAIYPLGFELLARDLNPRRALKAILELARAAGGNGMVGGQYLEVMLAREKKAAGRGGRRLKALEERQGRLHSCAAACGAIIGGASEEEEEKLRSFGFYVGVFRGYFNIGKISGNEENEVAERFRSMALRALDGFDAGKIRNICSLLDVSINNSKTIARRELEAEQT